MKNYNKMVIAKGQVQFYYKSHKVRFHARNHGYCFYYCLHGKIVKGYGIGFYEFPFTESVIDLNDKHKTLF